MLMKCEKCGTEVTEDEMREHAGRTLCEDCYMDIMMAPKACDPWAVHSAKSLEKHGGSGLEVTDLQSRILKFLEETGGAEPHVVVEKLNITFSDLEREVAALRHMEKVRGEMRENKKRFLRLW